MSHFKPTPRHYAADPYGSNAALMEGAKANYTSALLASESCMRKCNLTEETPRLSDVEGDCLRQCFVKYFDCQLLVNNEMTNYVRGLDL